MAPLVVHVTGARPNFPKAAPVLEALAGYEVEQLLVHTGQHYDDKMSDVFFRQLGIPKPDVNLGVGSGAHGAQTAKVMIALEELFTERRPDLVVVYGDVNSTVAAALVASKLGITFAHVEAGRPGQIADHPGDGCALRGHRGDPLGAGDPGQP